MTPNALPPRGIIDDAVRAAMKKLLTEAARMLLDRRIWRNNWSVEIDGCVFKFKINGYAKHGTPIWEEQQRENREALAEYRAEMNEE